MSRRHTDLSLLPSGYEPLEYLEATGTQYIEINVNIPKNSNFSFEYKFKATTNRNDKYAVFGSYPDDIRATQYSYDSVNHNIVFGSNVGSVGTSGGWSCFLNSTVDVKISNLQVEYFKTDYDGNIIHYLTPLVRNIKYNLTKFSLFKTYETGVRSLGVGAFNYILFKVDDEFKFNLIPCLRKSDNKPGLYDLCGSICPLTGTPFYINAGSGEFIGG